MKVFGERLRYLRESRNMNQEDLGKIILDKKGYPVTKQTISYYELGKYDPSIDGLTAISNHFDVTIDYLLGRSEYMNPKHEQLQQLNIISKEAIDSLSTLYSVNAIKILDILFRDNSFAFMLEAFYAYYKGIPDSKLFDTLGYIEGIYFTSDMEAIRRQYMHFALGHLSERVQKYLDKAREDKESE